MKHTSNGGDKLEELFQNASAQYEVQPDPAGWERLHSQLRARQAPARRLFLLRSAFMILGFMLARYGLLNLHTTFISGYETDLSRLYTEELQKATSDEDVKASTEGGLAGPYAENRSLKGQKPGDVALAGAIWSLGEVPFQPDLKKSARGSETEQAPSPEKIQHKDHPGVRPEPLLSRPENQEQAHGATDADASASSNHSAQPDAIASTGAVTAGDHSQPGLQAAAAKESSDNRKAARYSIRSASLGSMTAPSAGQTFFQDVSVKVKASSQKPFDPSHRKSRYARPSSKEWRLYAYGGRGNARLRTNLASIYQVPTYDGAMNIYPDAQYADYSRKMSELQSTRLGVQFIRTLSRNQRWFVSTGFEYQQWERRLQYYHNRSPRNQNLAFFDYQPHHHLGYDVAQKQTTNRYRFASVPLMIGYRLPAWGALQIDCSLGAGYQYLADALGMEYHFYYEEFQQEDTRSQEIYRSHSFHGRSGININYTLSNWVDLRAGVQYQHAFQSLYERHYPIDLHIDPITWEFGVSHRL